MGMVMVCALRFGSPYAPLMLPVCRAGGRALLERRGEGGRGSRGGGEVV